MPKSKLQTWIRFNLVLLALYLGFFYCCLIVEFPWSLVIGWGLAGLVTLICVCCRHLFLNRYECVFYSVLPLDMVLESLVPVHTGYSFFACATSFWLVFILYRIYLEVFGVRARQPDESPVPFDSVAGSE